MPRPDGHHDADPLEQPATILLVDDSPAKRLAMRSILEPAGHVIVEAESGEAALHAVRARPFAVVLMDVHMPGMDGYETAKLIRLRQESESTPIIFVTAHARDETQIPLAYASGAVDFIFAPLVPQILRAKVAVFVELFLKSLELTRRRRQLEEAETVGGFGSWEHDMVTGRRQWSAGMFRLLGMEPGDEPVPFDQLLASVHPDDRAALDAAEPANSSISAEYRIRRRDGSERVLHARREVIFAEDGTPLWQRGTEQDITERRAAERAKDEFTSVVSHELRTPLTSIRGSLGLLESGVLGPLPDRGQRMVEIAVENTDRLVRLINDILDIERINSGLISMQPRPCDAADLIARAIDGLRQFAADAGVTLATEVTSVTLPADPDRVLQALTNLISNAVKFSPPGGTVRLTAGRTEEGVRFDVRDEGRGIPPDKLESIFERFQQVDASDSREKGGTGLGLAICRTVVERHGGRIWVESELGTGSTFSFVLPAGRNAGAPAPKAPASGPTILVCDDDAAVVEVVAAMLEHRGFHVIAAHSGAQALMLAAAERPDAILLDFLMPELTGSQTAALLAEQPETRDIPVVMLSVLSQAEAGAQGEGFFSWVEKPIDEYGLFAAVERAIRTQRSDRARVLVVEDDDDMAETLIASLTSDGAQTFRVADGHAAILLSARILPDLMVLDLGLPEMDGFGVVEWLRRHERLRHMDLLVYSGRDLDDTDRERLQLGGTTEFLTKTATCPAELAQQVLRRLAALDRHAGVREALPVA